MTTRSFTAELIRAVGGSPSKQAALFLRDQGDVDRQWLLSQLRPAASSELESLLAELDGLEVNEPIRPGITKHIVSAPASAPRAALPSAGELALEIMRAPMRDVVAELRHEPGTLIVRLLRHADPAWTRRFLGCLEADQKRRLEASLSLQRSGQQDAFDIVVLELLTQRLATSVGGREGPAAILRRLAAAIRRLRPAAVEADMSPRAIAA